MSHDGEEVTTCGGELTIQREVELFYLVNIPFPSAGLDFCPSKSVNGAHVGDKTERTFKFSKTRIKSVNASCIDICLPIGLIARHCAITCRRLSSIAYTGRRTLRRRCREVDQTVSQDTFADDPHVETVRMLPVDVI